MAWFTITSPYQHTQFARALLNTKTVSDLPHTLMTADPLCRLMKIEQDDTLYYVKHYQRAGRYLRRFFGLSRVRREWQNLQYFQSLGIPTPPIVAYGESRHAFCYQQGLLITEEIGGSLNLLMLARQSNSIFYQFAWRDQLSKQIADYVYRLHTRRFIHRDLKWRNILVKPIDNTLAYFFDSTCGKIKKGWFFKHGMLKDLASLDRMAVRYLSKTERLRFYLRYKKAIGVTKAHKKQIKQILHFFG